MYTGMKEVDGTRYYFHSWGGVYHNESFTWQGKKYKTKDDGTFYTGVCDINGKKYYFLEDGEQITKEGWYLTNGTYYWINKDTSLQTGWVKYDNNWYWMKEDGTMASSEWITYDKNRYYFRSWGGMYKNAFITYDNNLYYLGSDSKMAIGWQSIGGNTYYFRSWGCMITGKQVIDGKTYVFDEDGKLVQSPDGFEPSAQIGVRTVRNFLKNALLPLGNTLYIWGGGHTDAEAESYGVNAQWKQFFNTQNSTYNYSDHLYEYGKGLDCSGYVGWTAHQVTKEYATTTSTGMPAFNERKGWRNCNTYYQPWHLEYPTASPPTSCRAKAHCCQN